MSPLRSSKWFAGDDEVAMLHRVAVSLSGYVDGTPTIGITVTSSDLNPCHGDVSRLLDAAKDGIREAGGTPFAFPTISLGEDLMKPSAMMYRNLLSIEIEEMIRSTPLDGILIFAGCDKNVPAALMALASSNLPGLVALVGIRQPGCLGDRRLGAGTDVWRELEAYRAGTASPERWSEVEAALMNVGPGICNVMGTAVSMGIVAESLGMALPGTTTMAAGGEELLDATRRAGMRVVQLVADDVRPDSLMTEAAMRNSSKLLAAAGGSTNAVIHLCAIAGRTRVTFGLNGFEEAVREIPLLVDVEPCGAGLAQDFQEDGSVPALFFALKELLDQDVTAADGQPWSEHARATSAVRGTIRSLAEPLAPAPTFAVIHGTLAPDGALVKVAAASPGLLTHSGPAVVFNDYHDMRERLDDPNVVWHPDSVIVVRDCGPVGAPGMPEWGMAPIPRRLAEAGVTDMVRLTDGRMSGTSFGTVVLHVAPESAVGGPLGLLQDGDLIELNVPERTLELLVPPEVLAQRSRADTGRTEHVRGWPRLYQEHVLQAPQGCDLDFLVAPKRDPGFIEPVVGRS